VLSVEISKLVGDESLYFFDAAAPIVKKDSINMEKAFAASRYNKGSDDYINCPMNKEEYTKFYNALISAETAEVKDFDKRLIFEGCMPVEIMAARGIDTLRYGPMKPVGIINPHTGTKPYAVVQLRQDNFEGTLFNIVGFQTRLKWSEQKKVFSMIPGLENAEFVRFGVMHRNTFINSPVLLMPTYRMRKYENIYFAGQITGVEGYVESTASGLVAGINAYADAYGKKPVVFPKSTAIGALANYISTSSIGDFQPININYGIIEQPINRIRNKRERYKSISKRALELIDSFKTN
jgi:methylenetetrahydrofolate--tRNA-(uracil-5-)-methyltransferase